MKSRKRLVIWILGICICAILTPGAIYLGYEAHRDTRLRRTLSKGDAIVIALREYMRIHERYPSRLEQLVPEVASSIAQPEIGSRQWYYKISPAGEFLLGFGVDDADDFQEPTGFYNSEREGWEVDTK